MHKITFISRVIVGEFPNYKQIIPNDFLIKIEVSRDELIQHIKTASCFSNKINEIIFQINPKKQQLEIMSQDQEYGSHQSTLACEVQGKEEKVLFNFQYLLDGIQNINSQTVKIKLNHATTPVVISSSEDSRFKYVLMPIKN